MTHLNIEKISLTCRDREKEEQKKNLRKKSILVLIYNYLLDNGFVESAESIRFESRQSIDDYTVCDNIHLESILQDFESYHFLKYQKLPVITKKNSNCGSQKDTINQNNMQKIKVQSSAPSSMRKSNAGCPGLEMNVNNFSCKNKGNSNVLEECDVQFLEPLGGFTNYNAEWKSMANIIMQDFGKYDKSITWSEIIGHERVKILLHEALVYPLKYSNIFRTNLTWKSVLLYGPTGTGKTLLAMAAAAESKANFFKVCISTLVSKWRGESEKLMRVLFDLAKHYAPSVIFIDEIDALISQRGTDHEASRRMKTEFFLQMDALNTCSKSVLLLGATNMPWELDHALLRRMEKRVLVPLPDQEGRICLFKKFLSSSDAADTASEQLHINYHELSNASNYYSASDIQLVCKEANMNCMRRIIDCLENYRKGDYKKCLSPTESLQMSDVLKALEVTKPATTEFVEKYQVWKEKHGSE